MIVKVGAIGEMEAEFRELKRQGNHLIATMEVPGAMPYDIIGTVNHHELIQMVKAAFKAPIIFFLLFGFRGSQKSEPPKSTEYW